MWLYAITDRKLFPGDEQARCAALLAQAERWAASGAVNVIQLREKDLPEPGIEALAASLAAMVSRRGVLPEPSVPGLAPASGTILLVNGPPAVARRAGAHGVHLASRATAASSLAVRFEQAREAWQGQQPVISVACHHAEEAAEARELGASMIVFAPVFEKVLREGGAAVRLAGAGLAALIAVCKAAGQTPVLALGGVSAENAGRCIEAGAAGVASIRLFLGDAWLGLASPSHRASPCCRTTRVKPNEF